MSKEEKTLPIPITLDLIKRLKAEGKNKDAQELLKAFRKNCQKNWKEEKKGIFSIDRKIRVNAGMCIQLGCHNKHELNKAHCRRCLERKKGFRDLERIRSNKNGN